MKSLNMLMWCIALICVMNHVISDQNLSVGIDAFHVGDANVSLAASSTVSDISSSDESLVYYHFVSGFVVNG